MSRFDYVKYDDEAMLRSAALKHSFSALEGIVEQALGHSRAKSLVLTKLEEAYMWCGKGIRDEQIARNGSAELQESRGNE